MTLNELFRRTGEPTYHTPIAVIGELVNQSGGQVTIINPPYHSQPRAWRKGWAKKLRIGRLYFYISNCRMKKRPIRDLMYGNNVQDHCVENKRKPRSATRTIPRTWAVYPQRHHALPQVPQGGALQPVAQHRTDEGESEGTWH